MRRLVIFNQGLLGKWLWRFACERDSWWRTLVCVGHREGWGEWSSQEFVCRMGWEGYEKVQGEVSLFSRMKVGRGRKEHV